MSFRSRREIQFCVNKTIGGHTDCPFLISLGTPTPVVFLPVGRNKFAHPLIGKKITFELIEKMEIAHLPTEDTLIRYFFIGMLSFDENETVPKSLLGPKDRAIRAVENDPGYVFELVL